MHGQLKIALKEVLKGALQQLLLEAGPFESFSKKALEALSVLLPCIILLLVQSLSC